MTSTDACPCCRRPYVPEDVPPEPPVGTWMKDRYGGVTLHQRSGGWGPPGMMPFGKWEAMWRARGPYVECAPWGREPEVTT